MASATALLPLGFAFGAALPLAPAAGAVAFLPLPQRPKRPPRSGAAASMAMALLERELLGSRSLGILAFFFLSVMYGP